MAPVKRKSVDAATGSVPANKRLRLDSKGKADAHKTQKEKGVGKENRKPPGDSQTSTKPSPASILTKEQPAFPRGGAGLLTPLERKQILAKATRDAIAEHKESRELFGTSNPPGDVSSGDEVLPDAGEEPQKPKKISKKEKRQAKYGALQEESRGVRIEGLSYKRLSEGSLILGQVARIHARDLTIALPNNLTGIVSLTSISSGLTGRIESLLAEEGVRMEEGNDEEDINLEDYFSTGQYLRVCVTSLGEDASGTGSRSKRNIELSLEPQATNAGLKPSDVVAGCTLQASVVSVEDHGVVVDLGLKGGDTRGFIPEQELSERTTLSSIKKGAVVLCLVTDVSSNRKIIKLSAKESRLGNSKQSTLKIAPVIDSFLPGTLVEILLTEVVPTGLAGQVMGMLNVTADLLHADAYGSTEDFQTRYKIGKKIKGRLLYTFPLSDPKKLGFSVLENTVSLQNLLKDRKGQKPPRISTILSDVEVTKVEPRVGVYLNLAPGLQGFAHISRLADNKVDSISDTSGQFKIGTRHKARILDYNFVDNLALVSLQPRVLQQPFMRMEDVPLAEKVTGTVAKLLIGENGVKGLLVSLADGVVGMVPAIHLSDTTLQHPEKKFREGSTVTARVLSKDLLKQQMRLTLKKTLVNSDQTVWKDYSEISIGDSSPGTLVKVERYGAIVQFYGSVKGFLPVSEISEAYIKDATEHFRIGQVVTVNAISVAPESKRLTLSCRELTANNEPIEASMASLSPGTLATGTVFEKSQDDLLLRLEKTGVIARLTLDHISDGSLRRRQSALSKIRVGQVLQELLIWEVQAKRRIVFLSNRSSLVKASKEGSLLKSFSDLREGMTVTGLVSNVTASDGIFVSFAGGISGLIPKSAIPREAEDSTDFGVVALQPVTARISSIDYKGALPRFWLTMREGTEGGTSSKSKLITPFTPTTEEANLVDPVDETVKMLEDLQVGKITKARVVSVKDTQINVELAKNVHGRIDVSAVFDSWDDIKDRKKPLRKFSAKQILSVKILGAHDTRNHRFLPLTHRSGRAPVFELTAKKSDVHDSQTQTIKWDAIKPESSWLAFVNNIGEDCLWVSIFPGIRGRIRSIDVSDDLSLAGDLSANFPIGSAIRVHVLSVDASKHRLDLSAKQSSPGTQVTLKDITKGTILPGKITRVSPHQFLVQLSDTIVGAVNLIDMEDDYSQANPFKYEKNSVIRAYVIDVDIPNKKIALSIRPSKVLSSSLTVTDPEVTSVQQLSVNDICRGFISNVTDQGIFVVLGHKVTAHVQVRNLSDSYLKEWKDSFECDALVKGKIVSIDKSTGHVQMSLKESVLNADYKPPLRFADMQVGDNVTGKVVKVETFGVFILVDNSENVRGLCHRSEIAEQRIEDASKLFSEGDVVKAKVLKLELAKRRINFGMKASYFTQNSDEGEEFGSDDDEGLESGGMLIVADSMTSDEDEEDQEKNKDEEEEKEVDHDEDDLARVIESDKDDSTDRVGKKRSTKAQPIAKGTGSGLNVGGFDWYGLSIDSTGAVKRSPDASDAEDEKLQSKPKKNKRKAEIQIDRTGDLDAHGPRSADDFERLLLGSPDSSLLWLQYMAFYLELGDVDQARQIGERALKSIGLTQENEKLNVRVALLNLENAYGDDESIEAVFHQACEYNDPQEVHARLTSIYIQSGKEDKADQLFQAMIKKFGQDPKVWVNYATFLFDTVGDAEKGRALLSRALQTLPQFTHLDLTSKFAQLEFRSPAGLPERGRTIFEGLLNSFPKRVDLFNVLLDLEIKLGDAEQVRTLFERIFSRKVKPKQARFFFKRWLAFEEKEGDERMADKVKVRAADWVKNNAG